MTNIDYKITNLYKKRYIGRREKLNKIVILSSNTVIANDSPLKQDFQTAPLTMTFMKTDEMCVGFAAEMFMETEINIPFVSSTSLGFKLNGSSSQIKSQSELLTVTAPTRTVTLDPFTKVNVTFNFYQYEDVSNYYLDFALDDSSTISYPDFHEDVYYGDPRCCEHCLLFKNNKTISTRLDVFLRDNHDLFEDALKKCSDDKDVKIERVDDKLIVRNFANSTETIMNFGVDIVYGTPVWIF